MLKRFGWLAVLVLGFQPAWAFTLGGPVNEDYQDPVIGYDLPGDIMAPKNIGEEYRWNTPTNWYAFDKSFLDYFGSNGVNAVEQAIGIINALTNTPFSSIDLNQFPLEVYRINPLAESLHLIDLKTQTLETMIEELPLAQPDRYVWTLRDRYTQPGASCPLMIYHVIMRNFDPFTFDPSPYINGVLYTYIILEFCQPPNPVAVTRNFPVDPTAQEFSAIATRGGIRNGSYAVGLSRDDVGGLRYLYRTNNVNWESASSDSVLFSTNTTQAQLLFTSNLTLFAYASLTNTAADLQTLYPGLQILGTTNTYSNVVVTTITPYFTNYVYDPIDALPHLVFATNRTLTIQTIFHHTYGNLVTFSNTPNGYLISPIVTLPPLTNRVVQYLETIAATNAPWMPVGTVYTNNFLQAFRTNGLSGYFAILPTNACSAAVIGVQAYFTNYTTNLLMTVTNTITSTNTTGGATNGFEQTTFYTQNLVTRSVDPVFLIYPVECLQTNSTLIEGMDTITFLRSSYDSLIGRYFQPITNNYTLIAITNSIAHTNYYQRIVTSPDVLFGSWDINDLLLSRSQPLWVTNNIEFGLAGPGTINPGVDIRFNRVGPLIYNVYDPFFVDNGLTEATAFGTNFVWASFSGDPNDFILYPNNASIDALYNEILFSIISRDLPDGSVGVPYTYQLEVAGGQTPYVWAPTWDSEPLPPGLTLSNDGIISGTPTEAGTFNFTVMVTEGGARISTRTLTLTINP